MRTRLRKVHLVFGLLAATVAVANVATAQDLKLEGNWKFVVSPQGDTEFLVFKATAKDGKPSADVLNFNQQLGAMEIRKIEQQGDAVTLTVFARGAENVFSGKLVKVGDDKGQVLGMFHFLGRNYPARIERTEADKVAAPGQPAGMQQVMQARAERDPKAKIEKLRAALSELKGPAKSMAYLAILDSAAAAGLTEQDIRQTLNDLVAVAKPYGDLLATEYRTNALRSLQGKKPFANIALELAQEAEKNLPADATLEQQAGVLQALAISASLAGKAELAATASARAEKIDHQLDEDYHKKVPPFKPEIFAGRENKQHDKVVVMEIFTGAQCPPCVSADVAFDALISTYKPTELVTLQYHLHIPGPDPMTNADTEARARFYGVNSTPSIFLSGAAGPPAGGGMAQAEARYGTYRKAIDPQLAGEKGAKIDLRLTRSGEQIMVAGTAQAKSDDSAKLRLRLVLTEEIIKYIGGNQLRFHHHVVRALPGGVEGKELKAGEATINQTIDLTEVRQTLADYVGGRTFANTPPEMGKELSLVAIVQNDADKSILHAIVVPVPAK